MDMVLPRTFAAKDSARKILSVAMETPPSQPTLCGTDSRKFHDLSNGWRVDIRTDRMVV